MANFNPFKVLNDLKNVNSHPSMSVIRFCSNKYRITVGSNHLSGWRLINDKLLKIGLKRPILQQFLIKISQVCPIKVLFTLAHVFIYIPKSFMGADKDYLSKRSGILTISANFSGILVKLVRFSSVQASKRPSYPENCNINAPMSFMNIYSN